MIKHLTAALAAAALMTGAASAKPISFADFAAGNEGGIANLSSIDFGDGFVIEFQSGATNQFDFFPYFDDVAGGKPGGLGVCRELTGAAGNGAPGAECLDSSDDNVDGDGGIQEFIELMFTDKSYDLIGISFRDGDHNLINDSLGLIDWFVDGSGIQQTSIADFVALVVAGAFSDVSSIGWRFVNQDFYIESISDVPIPAALPLLLSGIAGLGFASRRKKKAA